MPDLRGIGFSEIRARLASNRLAVYDALLQRGPSTGSELAKAMGWSVLSVRPRLTELVDMFHAQPTGERRDSEHVFMGLSTASAQQLHAAVAAREAAKKPVVVIGQISLSLA